MSDVTQKAAEAAAKIAELQKERADLEASASAHEAQAREDRRAMTDRKKQIGEWTAALNTLQVRTAVNAGGMGQRRLQPIMRAGGRIFPHQASHLAISPRQKFQH